MKSKTILTIIFLLIIYMYVACIYQIPSSILSFEGDKIEFKVLPGIEITESIKTFNLENEFNSKSLLEVSILGNITIREIDITNIEDVRVVPIGKVVGLKLYTNGVLVVGMSEIEDLNNNLIKPYEKTDIKEGDMIFEIDGKEIGDINNLKDVINNSGGKKVEIKLLREGKTIVVSNIIPAKVSDKEYKLGLWVKDAATGVGTLTFYEPESKSFALLGHGITDADTNSLIYIDSGELVTSKVISVEKGIEGKPGEIRGTILKQKTIGEVNKNTNFGVYGKLTDLTSLNINTLKTCEVALRSEIKEEKATILCASDSQNLVKEYEIEIEKVYLDNDYNNKSMLIRITDSELINKTGGIIRGLSGAPIMQNGKFIGAITNVLVSNPEIGYGIFADLMIKEMKK